jgi:hypothetical protein
MIQNPPQMTGGQQLPVPTIGQPYPGIPNPIWDTNSQTHVPAQGYNPSSYYPLQPPPNLLTVLLVFRQGFHPKATSTRR